MTEAELHDLEDRACPGAGACGGQFTANTMSTAMTILGISPMGANDIPALDERKGEAAYRCGEMVLDLLRKDIRPSRIITRATLENAITSVAATGGSTNAVLHLLAIAYESGVPLALEDFDRIASRTPVIADLKPGGRFTAPDMDRAGGIRLLTKRLLEADLICDHLTVSGTIHIRCDGEVRQAGFFRLSRSRHDHRLTKPPPFSPTSSPAHQTRTPNEVAHSFP